MKFNLDEYNGFFQREKGLEAHIPYVGIYENCLISKAGELVRTWHIEGRFFETTDSQDLNHRNQQLNSFLRSITSSQVAMYVHRIRSDDREEIHADYCSNFGNDFADKYMRLVANRDLKRTDLYLTLVYSPYVNRAQRFAQKAAKRTTEQIKQDRLVSLEKMKELSILFIKWNAYLMGLFQAAFDYFLP